MSEPETLPPDPRHVRLQFGLADLLFVTLLVGFVAGVVFPRTVALFDEFSAASLSVHFYVAPMLTTIAAAALIIFRGSRHGWGNVRRWTVAGLTATLLGCAAGTCYWWLATSATRMQAN